MFQPSGPERRTAPETPSEGCASTYLPGVSVGPRRNGVRSKRIAVAAGGHWKEIADELIKNGLEEDEAVRAAGLKKHPPGMVLMTDLACGLAEGHDLHADPGRG